MKKFKIRQKFWVCTETGITTRIVSKIEISQTQSGVEIIYYYNESHDTRKENFIEMFRNNSFFGNGDRYFLSKEKAITKYFECEKKRIEDWERHLKSKVEQIKRDKLKIKGWKKRLDKKEFSEFGNHLLKKKK
jgi:hypothetical protein